MPDQRPPYLIEFNSCGSSCIAPLMEIGTLPFELSFLPLGKWAYMLLSDRYTRQVGLDGTVLLFVPTAVAREVDYPIAGATGVGDPLFLPNDMGTADTTRDGKAAPAVFDPS